LIEIDIYWLWLLTIVRTVMS